MPTFVVRLKNGHRLFSRHYTTNKPEQAGDRAKNAKIGRVLSVKKVKAGDVIGTIKSMKLDDIIGVTPKVYNPSDGIVFEDTLVSDVMFPKKNKKVNRRYYDKVNKEIGE